MGLATVLVTGVPFAQEAPVSSQVATAITNLVVGATITSLVRGVAARAVRPARPRSVRRSARDGSRDAELPSAAGPIPWPAFTRPTRNLTTLATRLDRQSYASRAQRNPMLPVQLSGVLAMRAETR
jgi:hypothetical protein